MTTPTHILTRQSLRCTQHAPTYLYLKCVVLEPMSSQCKWLLTYIMFIQVAPRKSSDVTVDDVSANPSSATGEPSAVTNQMNKTAVRIYLNHSI